MCGQIAESWDERAAAVVARCGGVGLAGLISDPARSATMSENR
jgi:hypothetical protein